MMPTPLEILLDPVSLGVLAMYGGLILWEALAPARSLPQVRGWFPRALCSFVIYFYLSSYLPLVWDDFLTQYRLFDLSHLGALGGAAIGVLVYESLLYGWHRAMHEHRRLFLGFHQMHHSAERLDTFGAFYFSPTDMAGFTLLGSLSLSLIVGLSPSAVTLFLFTTMFLGIFQHANVRTPRWLGYIVQRPESHAVHHQLGLHYYNFSDLPLFDMLLGTFRNPGDYVSQTGFYHGASARVPEMLAFQDVSAPPQPQSHQPTAATLRV
ncbi:MAG: sterol desaturase family protein [Halioglobus sp.]|jgi:sterol desaturase/sphingolipid hydroxylase (fatty acid hydroxylase superfamily)